MIKLKIALNSLLVFLMVELATPALAQTQTNVKLSDEEQMIENQIPEYLFKVIPLENWKKSQSQPFIILTHDDDKFIHLSKKDQLDRIIKKYWSNKPDYVVLKIESSQLPGKLIYEANPGGINKYYHLYDGNIPKNAVVDFKIVKSN